jgi:LAGLIDADG endonuclease
MATCRSKAQCDTPLTRDFCVLVNDQNGPKVSRNVALVKFGHMLENPWMLRYSLNGEDWAREPNSSKSYSSDNSTAAENQQERLVKIGWITGFVDGEGCFSINLIRQPHRHNRRGYKTGFQVAHEFAVTQGAKSVECLHMLEQFFGVGAVYINKRYDNHKEHMYRFTVRKRSDLQKTIIPFFKNYPLRTSKQGDFLKFAECLKVMETNSHLTVSGLIRIAEIMQTMNHCKSRTDLIRILRDYTPDANAIVGEDIVRAAWRHAG